MAESSAVAVPLSLAAGEPVGGLWRREPLTGLVRLLCEAVPEPTGRPRVVAVDGRSGGGKSTLAEQLHRAVPSSAVVHTDDIAWHHSFFDWDQLLAQGVLGPVRRGEAVRYRPPGWEAQGRPGSVDVPAGLELLVVEGVGAGRRELTHLLDAVVWVQSDLVEAERPAIERDVATGAKPDRGAAVAFYDEWMAQEVPFLDGQRPWERAVVIVAGTRAEAHDPMHVLLALPGEQLDS